jgi:hypothetical protein
VRLHGRSSSPEAAALRLVADGPEEPGAVDVHRLAADMGVSVTSRPLAHGLHGLTTGRDRVVISSELGQPATRYALAHELGHVLSRRGELPTPRSPRDGEQDADRFAHALLLPDLVALTQQTVSQSARRYGVDAHVVASRLAAAGLVPRIVRTLAGVVCCGACGFMARSPLCECSRYRSSASLAQTLPAVA